MGSKEQQPPMTVEEQVANLRSLGLVIESEEAAVSMLNDVSYFRLIKAFSLGLKPKNGNYNEGGTFNTPLPIHLENPDNRQPKAYVTIVNPKATILSMEQVFDEPEMMLMSLNDDAGEEIEAVPGYVEYKFRVELQHEDGTVTEEIISLYMEEK